MVLGIDADGEGFQEEAVVQILSRLCLETYLQRDIPPGAMLYVSLRPPAAAHGVSNNPQVEILVHVIESELERGGRRRLRLQFDRCHMLDECGE